MSRDDTNDSKVHCSPVFTSVEVLDPAPLEPPSAETGSEDLDSDNPVQTSSATEEPAQTSHEVLQKINFHYRLFNVHQHPPSSVNYRLTHFSPQLVGHHNIDIQVSDAGLDESKTGRHWKVEIYNDDCLCLDAADGGPDFTAPVLQDAKACPAKLQKSGDFAYDSQNMTPLSGKIFSPYADVGEPPNGYFGVVGDSKCTVIGVTLSTERRVSRRQWGALQCERAPAPKSALLKSAARTGDVILVGGEGVEAAAHSAVLVDIPYFEAKLREEWSGATAWNLHNKLRLRLPCAVDPKTLKLFLRCVYGDVRPLYKVEPTSLLLQELLLLADACNVLDVCADVIGVVEVTSANVNSWLEWLLKEHGPEAEPIQQQVVQVMRDQLQNALERQKLTVEQLAAMSRFLAGSDSSHVAPLS